MPEEIKLRMARAYPDQVQRVREWFQKLEEILDDEKTTSADYGAWIAGHYHEVSSDWERILFGYDTLIENVCDQTKSYLEFKPEIKEAISARRALLQQHEEDTRQLAQLVIQRQALASKVNSLANIILGLNASDDERDEAEEAIEKVLRLL